MYHSKWDSVNHENFRLKDYSSYKGGEIFYAVNPVSNSIAAPEAEAYFTNTVASQYMRMIIHECKTRNIEVLMTFLPFVESEGYWSVANTGEKIAEEYGIPYLNFYDIEVIDLNTDMHEDSHMNLSGAIKISRYIGDYLSNNYDLQDRRDEAGLEYWWRDYNEYIIENHEAIKNAGDLDDYLMLANQEGIELSISSRKNEMLMVFEEYKNLFDNIGSIGGQVQFIEDRNVQEGVIFLKIEIDGLIIEKAEFDLCTNSFTHVN